MLLVWHLLLYFIVMGLIFLLLDSCGGCYTYIATAKERIYVITTLFNVWCGSLDRIFLIRTSSSSSDGSGCLFDAYTCTRALCLFWVYQYCRWFESLAKAWALAYKASSMGAISLWDSEFFNLAFEWDRETFYSGPSIFDSRENIRSYGLFSMCPIAWI